MRRAPLLRRCHRPTRSVSLATLGVRSGPAEDPAAAGADAGRRRSVRATQLSCTSLTRVFVSAGGAVAGIRPPAFRGARCRDPDEAARGPAADRKKFASRQRVAGSGFRGDKA